MNELLKETEKVEPYSSVGMQTEDQRNLKESGIIVCSRI